MLRIHSERTKRTLDKIQSWRTEQPARDGEQLETLTKATTTELSTSLPALEQLEQQLLGTVVRPGDPDYEKLRRGINPAYNAYPKLIILCECDGDVRLSLKYARDYNLKPSVRSGGHNFANYCVNDDMVIDLSQLNQVHVDYEAREVVTGVGTKMDKLGRILDGYNLHIPQASDDSVAIGGYLQAGGYSMTARAFGMNCDSAISFRMMLADGSIVRASETVNSDLFDAVRGGTGNNFGVLLDVTYRAQVLASVFGFRLQWSNAVSAEVMRLLCENYAVTAPQELGYLAGWVTDPRDPSPEGRAKPVFTMMGIFLGTAEQALELLQPLLQLDTAELQLELTGPFNSVADKIMMEPYPPVRPTEDEAFVVRSNYVHQGAGARVSWQDVATAFDNAPCDTNFITIEPYGGEIAKSGGNAFVHRSVMLNVWLGSYWKLGEDDQPAKEWRDEVIGLVLTGGSETSCQSYPDRDQKDFRGAYWKSAYPELVRVKNKYDPDCLFQFQQSIGPPASTPASSEPIVFEPYAQQSAEPTR